MTYNIRSGNGNLDGIAVAIRASAPDLVGLLEVDVHWAERSNFVDQATSLSEQLKMQVRFARIYQLPGVRASDPLREFGVALLSKYPIVEWTNHIITRLSTQEENPVPGPLPGFLEAKIDVGGTMVRVFDTHLDDRSDPRMRRRFSRCSRGRATPSLHPPAPASRTRPTSRASASTMFLRPNTFTSSRRRFP